MSELDKMIEEFLPVSAIDGSFGNDDKLVCYLVGIIKKQDQKEIFSRAHFLATAHKDDEASRRYYGEWKVLGEEIEQLAKKVREM